MTIPFVNYVKMVWVVLICLLCIGNSFATLFCEEGYCATYRTEVGCTLTSPYCGYNNATHKGLLLNSPTICNCCDYCLPFYGDGESCSVGGPGTGVTVGRCGDGLTCVTEDSGNFCRRMQSDCHSAQDEFDERHLNGETGSMEQRPICDEKAKYAAFDCVPAYTCFCQSKEGDRLFGEVLNLGTATMQHMHCGCSRLHEQIKTSIAPGVSYPVIGPRCTSDGNFNPVQCTDRVCYCVNKITGVVDGDEQVDLDEHPITKLSCYDSTLDLFPDPSQEAPYNYTTPCFEDMKQKIEILKQSEAEGYNVDYFSEVPECMPDGTYGRIGHDRNGSKICLDEWGLQIDSYQSTPGTEDYETMNCKCAQTSLLMKSFTELPVCCNNGNYRPIQCRRGVCRCVDENGQQYGKDSTDVSELTCYTNNWKTC